MADTTADLITRLNKRAEFSFNDARPDTAAHLREAAAALEAAEQKATEEYARGFLDGTMDEWKADE